VTAVTHHRVHSFILRLLRDINDFAAMNEVYATFFSAPFPDRTTIQAGALPGGIAVEIECIAKKTR
jgi:2-iminobutanoate/2-iminopropanoate deaminase